MITKVAVLYKTNGSLVMEELETPPLQRGQVLVKILYTGICRSQLNEIKAHKCPDKYLPHTLGHEASGIVKEIGPEVKKVKKGDYVVLTWIKGRGIEAGGCTYTCIKNGKKINVGPITTFSEYSVISENRLIPISKKIPSDVAALFGCAIPTGMGIIRNELKVKKGESIAIFGVGGIGTSVLLGAVAAEASPIIAIDINPARLAIAKKAGADYIINSKEVNVVKKIKELTEDGVDYSVDCSGITSIIELAFESINYKGTTIIAGNPAQGEKIKLTPFDFIKGKKIKGSWGGASNLDNDISLFVDDYLKKNIKFENLITKKINFNEINEGLLNLEKGNQIRILIKMCD